MAENKDIVVLAKKVYELSILPVAELEERKLEALLIVNVVYSSATKAGVASANADKEARWGDQIREEGLLSALHPKWHLRTDDGKPPAASHALANALDNPHRDLRTRYAALLLLPAKDREPLVDLARALLVDAWEGADVDARVSFSRTMNRISKTWTKEPWRAMDPHDGAAPVLLLLDGQGVINDGSMLDKDPTDDPLLSAWDSAIRTWDINFIRDNELVQLYTKLEKFTTEAVGTAGELLDGANQAAKGLAKMLAWMPYVLGGIGAIGATAFVVTVVSRPKQVLPAGPPLEVNPP